MIQLTDAKKVYNPGTEMEKTALNGVDFHIKQGEFTAVMGPSGSGKSTLLHVIGCLDSLTSGSFLLDGHELAGKPERELQQYRRNYISYVFQDFALMGDYTIRENIEFPLRLRNVAGRLRRQKTNEILERLGIEEIAEKYPGKCSGGQKQRAAIARAFVADRPVFLADEPTGALDSVNSEEVMRLIGELHRSGKTIVLITHEPAGAAYAERTVYLYDGQLTAERHSIETMEAEKRNGKGCEMQ